MKESRQCVGLLCAAAVLFCAHSTLAAGIDQNNTDLPPDGVYLTPDEVHARYEGEDLDIVLSGVQHQPILAKVGHTPTNGGLDEIESFNSLVFGLVSVNGGTPFPLNGSGPVSVLVMGHGPLGSQTGTFQTEMLSMNLTAGPALIRESPTQQSLGQTTITPIGGGMYHIDSFFDVFTELSLDGGITWIPDSNGSAHVILEPEPSTVTLLAIGVVGLGICARRRRRVV